MYELIFQNGDESKSRSYNFYLSLLIFKILFIFFKERGREGEREGKTNVQGKDRSVALHTPPHGDLASNPGMCPDQESNLRPFTLQNDVQPTEPHQSGQEVYYLQNISIIWKIPPWEELKSYTLIPFKNAGMPQLPLVHWPLQTHLESAW